MNFSELKIKARNIGINDTLNNLSDCPANSLQLISLINDYTFNSCQLTIELMDSWSYGKNLYEQFFKNVECIFSLSNENVGE